MSSPRRLAVLNQTRNSRTLHGVNRAFLILLATSLSHGHLVSAESAHDAYVRAVEGLGQYRENMNGRWFAVKAVKTYVGAEDSADKRLKIHGSYGVLFYSEKLLYVNVQRLLSSTTSDQPFGQHRELLVTGNWSVSITHSDERPTLKVSMNRAGDLQRAIWAHDVDIVSKFDSQVRRFAEHEFAQPRFDLEKTLIVSFDREDYLRNPADERGKNTPKVEVRFAQEPTLRPVSVCSFEVDATNRRKPLAMRYVQYAESGTGRPILQRILTETGIAGKSQTIDDLIVSETTRPAWCDATLAVSVPFRAPVEVTGPGTTEKLKSQLPSEISHLVRRLSESELKSHLARQQATLELSNDLVGSATKSLSKNDVAPTELNESDFLALSYLVPVLVASGVVFIVAFWPALWKRT